jgi:hypothetical protein
MKRLVKGIPFWETKKSDTRSDPLKVLNDKEIAAQVAKTLGFDPEPKTATVHTMQPQARVSLSPAEREARRARNRIRRQKRLEARTKRHGRQ